MGGQTNTSQETTTVEHSHQDGWWGSCQISCVYYFRKPKGSSNIKFCNPNDYILRNQPYAMMKGIHTIASEFPAEQYEYIIFPSWVRHRVDPSTVGPRIAMSFNFEGYDFRLPISKRVYTEKNLSSNQLVSGSIKP